MEIITAEVKDIVLHYLIENFEIGDQQVIPDSYVIHGITGSRLLGIIEQFGRDGLVECDSKATMGASFLLVTVNVEAHDFYQKGSFHGQYELFKNNVTRLLMQVERLEAVEGVDKKEVNDIGKRIAEYISLIANLGSIGSDAIDGLGG